LVLAALAAVIGSLAIFAVAFARETQRVDELQAQNDRILSDHESIGETFAQQTLKFAQQRRKLERALRSSFNRGFLAGQQSLTIPGALRSLARLSAVGFLVPRRLPDPLRRSPPAVRADVDGYAVRWRALAVFASSVDSLRTWTRQALGNPTRETLGRHRVTRLIGPSGVIYAWREDGVTYAVLASPAFEGTAQSLITSMR
jgi:hypothetical protein